MGDYECSTDSIHHSALRDEELNCKNEDFSPHRRCQKPVTKPDLFGCGRKIEPGFDLVSDNCGAIELPADRSDRAIGRCVDDCEVSRSTMVGKPLERNLCLTQFFVDMLPY